MTLGDEVYSRKKNRKKAIRTVFECIAVALIVFTLWELFFHTKVYVPYDKDKVSSSTDTGFVALSYFGVDRIGNTSTLIGEKQLKEHLSAMKDQGYVTITQEDIEDYYKNGKTLPKKALYLMFEDGRRDTAIFADNILENLNYKGVMMTYPEKFDHPDPKFLKPSELTDLTDSTFWELGTNGYRLEYINVYDRYHHFIGEVDPLTYAMMQPYLGRDYNHYLMDFIRDKDRVPAETMDHMKRRIAYDYERLRDLYTEDIGYVPQVHVLMHANTGRFGNTPSVSRENEKWIRKLFSINFNREGYSFNNKESSIYDLTRMQPQPYWPVNHLLMRIKYDTDQDVTFKTGDERIHNWDIIKGAAQYKEESLIVTSLPESQGLIRLKNSGGYSDVHIQVRLEGNSFGGQKVLFRGNKELNSYISAGIANGRFVITEHMNGKDKVLFDEKLSLLDGKEPISVDEDQKNVQVGVLEALTRYADTKDKAKAYAAKLEKTREEQPKTVAEGGEEYEAPESFHARLDRQLDIKALGKDIVVMLDGKEVASVETTLTDGSEIALWAGWDSNAWSQRNLADDVYDGVFERLIVSKADDSAVIYSTELKGVDKVKFDIHQKWESVLDFFLTHF